MRNNSKWWLLLSVVLMGAALWSWREGEKRRVATAALHATAPAKTNAPASHVTASTSPTTTAAMHPAKGDLRLRNTSETAGSLARKERAVLLRNALIDTTKPWAPAIPSDLRATNGRSFIVQAPHALDAAFYAALDHAGAHFVSYIPNNAALVEASADAADALTNQYTVLAYEPYFKLATDLLEASVSHTPVTNALVVTTPPGTRAQALAEIQARGWPLLGEDRTPLGPAFIIQPPGPDSAIAAAQWPLAQEVEAYRRRQPLNDLTRVRIGVASNTVTQTSYLGLTGTNIWMSLNDTGADGAHPDLVNRVYNLTNDFDGHGTHVAGIMIGDGTKSLTVSNVPGSVTGASFRGEAPQASLWVQLIDLVLGPLVSNEYLQTNASYNLLLQAQKNGASVTNGFISNNSWGTGAISYDLSAASFDAAVRDAQPLVDGEQAMTYVFAAGNSGGGSGNGLDGVQNTISSPGTAKNVITVGAIDSPRKLTNQVSLDCQTTNALFLPETSDSNQVAYFSSCGNVGPGQEGDFGRFKPDVVAPGVFIVSTRSSNFIDPTNDQFVDFQSYPGQTLTPGQTASYTIYVPADAQLAWLQTSPNANSPTPFPDLTIAAGPFGAGNIASGPSPLLLTNQLTPSGLWQVNVSAPPGGLTQPVAYDLNIYIVETNYLCDYFNVLSNLNAGLKPWYRYESGTSMAAPAASGVLALIQQYLGSNHVSPSPALLKALLINGARTLSQLYDFNTQPTLANGQGWGLIHLPNSLPQGTNANLVYADQSPLTALRTGEHADYTVSLSQNDLAATHSPVRVTLVWTDPPGNPAAGLALVNDLDLIVTDAAGVVYCGNNFHQGEVYTEAGRVAPDNVNNVENVYLTPGTGALQMPLTVTVRATRVNVNAVPGQTSNIEQDYALVVSSDDTNLASPLTIAPATLTLLNTPNITGSSNGVALVNQRVGANSPYDYQFNAGLTNGTLDQWHFFLFTNDSITYGTNFTNAAFIIFAPPNLSRPRATQEADLDLYVSTNPALLSLDSAAIAQAVANDTVSRQRGGTEAVVLSNSGPLEVYYIGVKSEDQQAAVFGFLGAVSQNPFSSQMANGDIVAHGIPLPLPIPDGAFDHPGTTNVLAVIEGGSPIHIRHVTVTNGIAHQNPGDLVGTLTLTPGEKQVTLNNHTGDSTNYLYAYDDEPEAPANPFIPTVPTDGPGSLRDYIGLPLDGHAVFRLDETDNALGQTGSITALDIFIEHQPPNTGVFSLTLAGYGSYYGYATLPDDATNLTITVTSQTAGEADGPLAIYATNNLTVAPGDDGITNSTPVLLVVDHNFIPPISGGTWSYLISNTTALAVNLNVDVEIGENLTPNWNQTLTNNANLALTTDAHTQSQLCFTNLALAQQVVSLSVGVRLTDPSLDNLVLHLQSPQGTSVLLFENRGGPAATDLGLDTSNANQFVYTTFSDDTNLANTLIKFTPVFAYSNATGLTTLFDSTFEMPDAVPGAYTNGQTVDGWAVVTNEVGVVNDATNAHLGNDFLALTTGAIQRTFDTVAGNSYQLVYDVRGPGLISWWPGDQSANDLTGLNNGTTPAGMAYATGEHNQAFELNGGTYVAVPSSASLQPRCLTAEGWIDFASTNAGLTYTFVDKHYGPDQADSFRVYYNDGMLYGSCTLSNTTATDLTIASPWSPQLGTWHHVAFVCDTNTPVQLLYVDGQIVASNAMPGTLLYDNHPFRIGDRSTDAGESDFFVGDIDETTLYNRALSPAEIAAIYQAGGAGKYSTNSIYPSIHVIAQGISTNIYIDANNSNGWSAVTNTFVATGTRSTVQISGDSALSMLLDDLSFVALPVTNFNNYFMPEEPMSPFIGQNPSGCWTLDVWDTRTDSSLPVNGVLKSWTLDMTFSSTNINLIVLTNHVPYTNTAPLAANTFFAFDVPFTAQYATNTLTNLTGGNLSLLFNQSALPADGAPGDFTLVTLPNGGNNAGTNTLDTTGSLPALVTGTRYFLAVTTPAAAAQNFILTIDTDGDTNGIQALANATPLSTNIATKFGQYYSFTVPPGATMASFQVLNPSGEVDLYASHGLPLPGPSKFDYRSAVYGTNNQAIFVTTNSMWTTNTEPVPLTPGTWYLAAFTPVVPGVNNVTYQIVATATTNLATIIPLMDGVPTNGTAPPGFTNVFYSFTNAATDAGVVFVVTNMSANVDLLVGQGSLPSPQQAYSGSFNPGTNAEYIQLPTSAAHTWYLAVPNSGNTAATYTIIASTVATGPVIGYPAIAGSEVQPGFGFTLHWNSTIGATYEVDYSTNLVTWDQAIKFKATNSQSSFTDFTPVTNQPSRYYRLRQVQQ